MEDISPWSVWSSCTRTCANGTKSRKRTCSNPAPRYGGNNCSVLGTSAETTNCSNPCPINGGYSPWSVWSSCTRTCANGTKSRKRTCSNPAPRYGGNNCSVLGTSAETTNCSNPCPINGGYSPWSVWSLCTTTCGNGTKSRNRTCSNPVPLYEGNNCSMLGIAKETTNCSNPCPINGGYSPWSVWSLCTTTCGNGTKSRNRTCSNPVPLYEGNNCSMLGIAKETIICSNPCPINGRYSPWSVWSSCTTTCGNGTKSRNRTCSNPVPLFGGNNCSVLGVSMEVTRCEYFCTVGMIVWFYLS